MQANLDRACLLAMYLSEAGIVDGGATIGDIVDLHKIVQAIWLQNAFARPFAGDVLELMARHEADVAIGMASYAASKVDEGRPAHG